jgi:hypothetical protein
MRTIGRLAALLLTLIAAPLFMLAGCNLAIEATLLEPDTYRRLLENDQIFEDFLPVALPIILEEADVETLDDNPSAGAPAPPDFSPVASPQPIDLRAVTEALPPDVWREVVTTLVPPDWLRARAEQLIRVLTGTFSGNFSVLDEPVDFDDIRRLWQGEEASDVARLIVTNAPNCTRTQQDELRRFIARGTGTLPICNPATIVSRNQSIEAIETWLKTVADDLPTQDATVSSVFDIQREDVEVINLLIEIDRSGLLLLFLCPLSLVSLIVVLAVRSLKGFGSWLAGTSLLTGVLLLILIFSIQLILLNGLGELLNTENEVEAFFSRVLSDFLVTTTNESTGILFIIAILFFIIGFVMLVVAFFAPAPESDASYVLVTEDGQIISTATRRRLSQAQIDQNTPTNSQ